MHFALLLVINPFQSYVNIYNQHGVSASTEECRYMINESSFVFPQSYFNHMSLLATIHCANTFMNV
jgi:hypothetical protein